MAFSPTLNGASRNLENRSSVAVAVDASLGELDTEEVDTQITRQDTAPEPSANYVVPEANRETWKNFGCDTEAGRMLRNLYSNKGQYTGISYPKPSQQKWKPAPKERGPCPQRAAVRVPRVTNRPSVASDAQPGMSRWGPPPPPGKKPKEDIIAETKNYEKEKPILPHGRDQEVVKERLQVQCEFGGGRMMPKGAMGNSKMEQVRVVNRMPASRRKMVEEEEKEESGGATVGMTREQKEMYAEKERNIEDMSRRLAEIDAEDVSIPVTSKLKTQRNKEALQLQNDIDRGRKDLIRLRALAG